MRGFEEKHAGVGSFLKSPLRKIKAHKRLKDIKSKNPDAFGAQSFRDKLKRGVQKANKDQNSLKGKSKKALGYGILGTGGAAYGGHKLIDKPKQQRTRKSPYQRRAH